jgi:hypothetical protein
VRGGARQSGIDKEAARNGAMRDADVKRPNAGWHPARVEENVD